MQLDHKQTKAVATKTNLQTKERAEEAIEEVLKEDQEEGDQKDWLNRLAQ